MGGAVGLGDEGLLELAAALDQRGQPVGQRAGWRGGTRAHGGAELGDDGGVDRVGFGSPATGPGVMPDASGLDDAGGDPRCPDGADRGLFVTAGGLTDELDGGMFLEEAYQSAVAGGRIGQLLELAGEVEGQGGLGHIQAGVGGDRGGGGSDTHTCKMRIPPAQGRTDAGNGSSQRAVAWPERAPRRVAHPGTLSAVAPDHAAAAGLQARSGTSSPRPHGRTQAANRRYKCGGRA